VAIRVAGVLDGVVAAARARRRIRQSLESSDSTAALEIVTRLL
jgi:hypothetical protein